MSKALQALGLAKQEVEQEPEEEPKPKEPKQEELKPEEQKQEKKQEEPKQEKKQVGKYHYVIGKDGKRHREYNDAPKQEKPKQEKKQEKPKTEKKKEKLEESKPEEPISTPYESKWALLHDEGVLLSKRVIYPDLKESLDKHLEKGYSVNNYKVLRGIISSIKAIPPKKRYVNQYSFNTK